ncbi:TioE family transcriptional regulator [Stackebrandtia nassauensis]|uniref:Transcriptional regulator, MerR family n=1 Tax=Stackebrandtia nassauensis (strain DSM 44728 / CIP 108903 / NRRL B-16338 / NBRC 102104 / LLR-40K-21) TaxID=446470 RepID=D3Q2P8_STANL|nr:TioE family transcriptional regulator [Stackebrandtia nassauensis]ADD45799.1 transcriptional regulator, MerR family [Stackebrandtia nassauensis DSM 44728]
MRPTDLAAEHGISTQAVRNYERDGYLPSAERTASGYRIYTEAHAAALRAYLALIPAYGHEAAGQIMTDVHDDDVDHALLVIDRGHQQLLRDRETLAAVENAIGNLMDDAEARTAADGHTVPGPSPESLPWTIGDLAHRLRVTPATLRNWEEAGILVPERNRATGYRVYGSKDIRDAELAHLLRRGGYPLEHIATVVEQIRTVGGTGTLAASLADWRRRLTARGLAMLHSATKLSDYLERRAPIG